MRQHLKGDRGVGLPVIRRWEGFLEIAAGTLPRTSLSGDKAGADEMAGRHFMPDFIWGGVRAVANADRQGARNEGRPASAGEGERRQTGSSILSKISKLARWIFPARSRHEQGWGSPPMKPDTSKAGEGTVRPRSVPSAVGSLIPIAAPAARSGTLRGRAP